MRVAPGVVRRQPDHVHDPADLLAPLGRGADPVDPQPLADAVADRGPRVQGCIRVLEDDLHLAPDALQPGSLEVRDVLVLEPDRARRRLDQAEQEPAHGRLPAAGFADEPERLAAADLEVDPVHGLHEPDRALEDPAPDREVLDEVADLDERRLAADRSRGTSHAGRRRRRGRGSHPGSTSLAAGVGALTPVCSAAFEASAADFPAATAAAARGTRFAGLVG